MNGAASAAAGGDGGGEAAAEGGAGWVTRVYGEQWRARSEIVKSGPARGWKGLSQPGGLGETWGDFRNISVNY